MNRILVAAAAALLVSGWAAPAFSADLVAGKAAFEKLACASCHGDDAKTSISPDYPILAGQYEDYLRQALRSYQRGQANAPRTANIRKNAVMGAMAASLSDEDIRNMSAWLASLPSPLSVSR